MPAVQLVESAADPAHPVKLAEERIVADDSAKASLDPIRPTWAITVVPTRLAERASRTTRRRDERAIISHDACRMGIMFISRSLLELTIQTAETPRRRRKEKRIER
jgi:hypothetical protein